MNEMTKNLRCGLIGKPLGHSYSPQIHALLCDYEYRLIELEENEVGNFLKSGEFDAINVTIPYKKHVMQFLDEISEEALRIGSVNTVTHTSDGRLRGDNTDYYGFSYMLDKLGLDLAGKKVLILGSGGASMTARAVSSDRGASEVVIISRSGEDNYTNLEKHFDCSVIVNTTPVGMYPNNGSSPIPISLSLFKNLVGVVDMIYNPSRTALILDAQELGIPAISGLSMLVAQAKAASELFTHIKIDNGEIDGIVSSIELGMKNIMMIGMPGVGKTTVGRKIAERLGREFVDTDDMIVEKSGMTIPDIFSRFGEDYFRELESEALAEVSKKAGLVISVGGGTVIRDENRRLMKQNSISVFLKRDLSKLSKDGRPISKANDLESLYEKRLPFYLDAADFELELSDNPDENAEKIIAMLQRN